MKANSPEFRRDVPDACDAGKCTRTVALRFKVSDFWVRRIKQERRESRKVEPLRTAHTSPKRKRVSRVFRTPHDTHTRRRFGLV